jgi:metal-sulfur cluster biosynthetic enzyme
VISRAAVDDALDRVVDPCSKALGVPLGLREMGLTTSVTVDDEAGAVQVTMRLTSPCCAYGPMLADAAKRELERVPSVTSASVEIDHAAVWVPADMGADAMSRLERSRRRNLALDDIRPHDWSTWEGHRT